MVKKIPVTELMEKEPVSVKRGMFLIDLVANLKRYGFRAMPVVDEAGKLVGVVSETDLFLKEKGVPFSLEKVTTLLGETVTQDELTDFAPTRRVKIEEVMSTAVVSLDLTATLEDVAMLMHKRHFSLIPIVDDGKLVGVVRRIDILSRLYRKS